MIQVENLHKSYGNLKAVNNLSLNIKEGEIYGLLGPNGAGKSTTINILSTLQSFDSGSIRINNQEFNSDNFKFKKIIGVVPQEISLYEDFSALDNLKFWGKLNQVPNTILKDRINELLELIGLSNRKNDLIKTYSGGMKRRINIAAALLHEPQILFMDEPTTGVDPHSRNKIFDIIETLNKKGMTIIYTTHYMEEVERLCDTIGIIDAGEVIIQGTKKELQEKCELNEIVEIEINSNSMHKIELFKSRFDYQMDLINNTLQIICKPEVDLEKILSFCKNESIQIDAIHIKKINLEAIFLQLTGKQLRD